MQHQNKRIVTRCVSLPSCSNNRNCRKLSNWESGLEVYCFQSHHFQYTAPTFY